MIVKPKPVLSKLYPAIPVDEPEVARAKIKPAPNHRVNKPFYMGASRPDILFVVDMPVGGPDDDEAPNPKTVLNKRAQEFLTMYCKKHEIPLSKAAITWPCDPVTSEVNGSQKRLNDHIKVHREEFAKRVQRANPKIIVAMGKPAASQVLNRAAKITQIRGTPTENKEFDCLVFPTLGVAHVIRIPENERMFDSDIATLKKIVNADYKLTYQDKIEQDYSWCTDLTPWIEAANAGPITLSADIEGVGLRWYDPASRVLTLQLCDRPGHAVAVPINYNHLNHFAPVNQKLKAKLVDQIQTLLNHKNVSVFGQNFKFDYLFLLKKEGITVRNWTDDTITLMHGVDENMFDKSLDEITRQWVPEMAGYADEFNRDPIHQKKSRMDLVQPTKMLAYGCGDVDATYRAKLALEAELRKDVRNYQCYRTVVMPALRAFAKIEDHGFPIDKAELQKFEKMLRAHQDKEYVEIRRMVPVAIATEQLVPFDKKDKATGERIKRASLTRPGFLRAMLFDHPKGLRIKPSVFTPSTRNLKDKKARVPSTSGKMHLAYFKDDHPFVGRIMEYITNEKLLGTYVGTEDVEDGGSITGFYKYLFGGRIRPTYLLHRTVTGRSASADPNGQNFPKRGKLAKQYRKIFVAPKGHVLIEVDFSQLELRIAAIMANDPTMLRLYREGADIHTATAMYVNGYSEEDWQALSDEDRAHKRFQAKAINFGFLYGMGWNKFMNYARTDYGVTFTEEEAQNIRNAFFKLYSRLAPWHEEVREFVKEYGYVRSFDGRVRHLPSVWSPDRAIASGAERQAINSPVQGFGSDLGLMAMALIVDNVDFRLVRPIGFIHDAIVCIAPEHLAKEACATIKHWMENIPLKKMFNFESPIPIVAEASVGKNLSSMIEIKDKWFANDNVISYHDIQIQEWEAKCVKADKAGEPCPARPVKSLPSHIAPRAKPATLPRIKPRPIFRKAA